MEVMEGVCCGEEEGVGVCIAGYREWVSRQACIMYMLENVSIFSGCVFVSGCRWWWWCCCGCVAGCK